MDLDLGSGSYHSNKSSLNRNDQRQQSDQSQEQATEERSSSGEFTRRKFNDAKNFSKL